MSGIILCISKLGVFSSLPAITSGMAYLLQISVCFNAIEMALIKKYNRYFGIVFYQVFVDLILSPGTFIVQYWCGTFLEFGFGFF